MKVVTLMENTACGEGLSASHGLSLYLEAGAHKILFDMGPDQEFLRNAERLGVDLRAVDTAVLSHGHYDHGGGLSLFGLLNDRAEIYLHPAAFQEYYALMPGEEAEYIGLDQGMSRKRFTLTGREKVIDGELTLFAEVADQTGALRASARLFTRTFDGFLRDTFPHEQNLLITAEGKSVLVAGCAHCGIVNILREAERRLGRRPDAVFGGFHLFQLTAGEPEADALIDETGRALLEGDTVYYTGHCTGDYAYDRLKTMLGGRLHRLRGGVTVEL